MVAGSGVARAGSAVVASFALVASLLVASPPAVAAVSEDPWAVRPPVESTAADPVVPSIPEGDFSVDPDDLSSSAGLTQPGSMGKLRRSSPVDLAGLDLEQLTVVERESHATTYDVPGAANVVVLSEYPQNVLVNGEWAPVDGVLERDGSGWTDEQHGA